MTKRIFVFFLIFLMFFGLFPFTAVKANAQYDLITDRSAVDGSDYTRSPAMARALNSIFDGNTSIYADNDCTQPVNTYLGTSPVKNNGILMCVGPEGGSALSRGTSCWIYANGVYYTLFGETTDSGAAGKNSDLLDLTTTATRDASYENFQAWGVRQGVGALIRASGHSMIVLHYDENSITILDGNSDGKGLVSICTRSWERFARYYSVSYIIQPKDQHYASLYAVGSCGENLTWHMEDDSTLIISGSGEILYPGWSAFSNQIRKIVIREGGVIIGNAAFFTCSNLKEIVFEGAAPKLAESAFLGVSATVHYPATQRGWAAAILQNYAGTLNWVPYDTTELQLLTQPEVVYSDDSAEITITAAGDGLRYTWYIKNPGEDLYLKSSFNGPVYSVFLTEKTVGQQVWCLVRDQYDNYLISQGVLLWPENSSLVPSFL